MSTNDDDREDDLFGALFSPLNRDAPAPDPEFRLKLHAQSLEVFAAQFAEGQTRVGGGSSVAPGPRRGRRPRNRPLPESTPVRTRNISPGEPA